LAMVLSFVTFSMALSIVPSVNYMETVGKYPEATVLAEALCGLNVNTNLVNELNSNYGDPLIAALALKVLGYNVPPSLLTTPASTVCDKAEKAFVYKFLGIESWKALIEEVLKSRPSEVLSSGLPCACKAAVFALLSGFKPAWLPTVLLEIGGKMSLDSLVWCSALQKLMYGKSSLEKELAEYISPNGALTPFPSSDVPDYYETAQFLIAYSLVQCGPKVKVEETPQTTATGGVSFVTITQTLTTFVTSLIKKLTTVTQTLFETSTVISTVTKTVTMYLRSINTVTRNVYVTRTYRCVTLNTPITLITTRTVVSPITLSPRSYVLRVLPFGEGTYQVTCNGGGTFYLGKEITPYPQYNGQKVRWLPQGGDFNRAPCDGSALATQGKTLTVMVEASNPVTLTMKVKMESDIPMLTICSK